MVVIPHNAVLPKMSGITMVEIPDITFSLTLRDNQRRKAIALNEFLNRGGNLQNKATGNQRLRFRF